MLREIPRNSSEASTGAPKIPPPGGILSQSRPGVDSPPARRSLPQERQELPDPVRKVARVEIRDDGHGVGSGLADGGGPIERDAADRDEGQSQAAADGGDRLEPEGIRPVCLVGESKMGPRAM